MHAQCSLQMLKKEKAATTTEEKQADDAQTQKLIYQAQIVDLLRNITVTWNKSSKNHFLNFKVENPDNDSVHYNCKIDLKASQLWCKKGLKNLDVEGMKLDVYWDFRKAKFSSSPSPDSDYYVAIASKQEVILLLGDLKRDAYTRMKRNPPLAEPTLLSKQETIFGKDLFCTRATLGQDSEEQEIVIENSLSGPGDPEMWIRINGVTMIHIVNLYWSFRGNESVSMKNNTAVQIFWDVHDWLFSESSSTYGLFMFNTSDVDFANNPDVGNLEIENQLLSGYCHLLYAWKVQ